jgi:hypothetical protein
MYVGSPNHSLYSLIIIVGMASFVQADGTAGSLSTPFTEDMAFQDFYLEDGSRRY